MSGQVTRAFALAAVALLALPAALAQDVNPPPVPQQVQGPQQNGQQTLTDLAVQDVWSDPYEPDSAHPFKLCADIQNGGSEPPNAPFDVSLRQDGDEFYVKHYDQFPKSQSDRICGNSTAEEGRHSFDVLIDPDHKVTDGDRSNNERNVTFYVTPPGQPDLTVSMFILNPPQPKRGEPLLITMRAANIGDGDAGAFYVDFTYDGKTFARGLVQGLAPGWYQTLFEQVDADFVSEGNHTFGVIVDSLNMVNESNEANNAQSKTVYFPRLEKPDLVVSNLTWPGAPALRDGEVVNLTARVANVGDVASTSFLVKFSTEDGRVIATPRLPTLDADSKVNVSVKWFARGAGNHTIHVDVDPDHEVAEANESNNAYALPVVVRPKSGDAFLPDLVPTRLLVQPDPPRPGQMVNLTAVIVNRGSVRGPAFTVTFLADGEPISEFRTSELPPGAAIAATARWKALEGIHLLSVVADRPGKVAESNKSNNERDLTVNVHNLAPPLRPPPTNTTRPPTNVTTNDTTNTTPPVPLPGKARLRAPEVRVFRDAATGRQWLAAKVSNVGSAVADAFTADFFDGPDFVGSADWSSLRPSNSTVLSVNWTNPAAGHHELRVFVHSRGNPGDPNRVQGIGTADLPQTARSALPAAATPFVLGTLAATALLVRRRLHRK